MAPLAGQEIIEWSAAMWTTTVTNCLKLRTMHRFNFRNFVSFQHLPSQDAVSVEVVFLAGVASEFEFLYFPILD